MLTIRPLAPNDTARVEYICRMTAGPGARKDPAIGNRVAKMYAAYYAREERGHSFVLDEDGTAVGYILCAPDFSRYRKIYRKVDARTVFRLNRRDGIFSWLMPLGYLPFSGRYPAHLHIDLLEGCRGGGNGSRMMETLLAQLRSEGIKGVMLIVDQENVAAQRFYKRNGFHKILSAFGGTVMAQKLK